MANDMSVRPLIEEQRAVLNDARKDITESEEKIRQWKQAQPEKIKIMRETEVSREFARAWNELDDLKLNIQYEKVTLDKLITHFNNLVETYKKVCATEIKGCQIRMALYEDEYDKYLYDFNLWCEQSIWIDDFVSRSNISKDAGKGEEPAPKG